MGLSSSIKSFLKDEGGNFATITGLLAITLCAAIGGATDLARLERAANQSQSAADAAALAAAKRLVGGTLADAKADIQAIGMANLSADLQDIVLTDQIDLSTGTVKVTAQGAVKTSFLPLIRIESLPFERIAVSTIKRAGFTDFYFLLDVSESMNIAADDVERRKLEATTEAYYNRKCAFACHEAEPYWHQNGSKVISVYEMNHLPGVDTARLRIDVLREAFDTTIDNILAINAKPDKLLSMRISTSSFSTTFQSTTFSDGTKLSADGPALTASIRNFTNANGHTFYSDGLRKFSTLLAKQGTGQTADSPEKIAVLITDGVKDDDTGYGMIDQYYCSQIKSKGIKLAVLEIKYIENFDYQNYFRDRVAPFYDSISPELQGCASQGLHYLATDSAQASTKLLSLTDSLLRQSMRLKE